MQTPGKKFSDLVEIEEIKDTDITVVRNETGVKKTPMQKISDYVKQKFIAWVFEDLPTEDKTIPGAFKELNSALTDKQDSLNGGSFAGGGNIDNIRKNTVVWVDGSSSETLPYNDYALILVISNGVNTVQVWFPFSGINPVSWRMYVNGAWQDWRHL